jgi:hypothetical protein
MREYDAIVENSSRRLAPETRSTRRFASQFKLAAVKFLLFSQFFKVAARLNLKLSDSSVSHQLPHSNAIFN